VVVVVVVVPAAATALHFLRELGERWARGRRREGRRVSLFLSLSLVEERGGGGGSKTRRGEAKAPDCRE